MRPRTSETPKPANQHSLPRRAEGRLITVSNRLPVSVTLKEGRCILERSTGGLATGLSSFHEARRSYWVGWPGLFLPREAKSEADTVRERLGQIRCRPVFLSRSDIDNYYRGFSNRTIWPLFHYFTVYTEYRTSYWQSYLDVNRQFLDEVLQVARKNDTIWIHDYHLMLLPSLLRERLPDATIGFFLHIPFPSFEVFRPFPWRRQILEGLLGADLVGFHGYSYVRHFISSVRHIMGCECMPTQVQTDGRMVAVDAFPMGIDYERFARAGTEPAVKAEAERIRTLFPGLKVILSVDRLDYTKGIVQRLEAYAAFLARYQEFRGRVTLVMIVVPSRTRVESYRLLKEQLEKWVSRVNGEYGTVDWTPVHYFYRSFPFERLVAFYSVADVALVTPLRDGMNLVAKEYIASKADGRGVLILSEMAGAAQEMGEALLVNPNDQEQVGTALARALTMSEEEQKRENQTMQERLRSYDVLAWADDFTERLEDVGATRRHEQLQQLSGLSRRRLLAAYAAARSRLILLDYDGTLVPFAGMPAEACPDRSLVRIIDRLACGLGTEVVIISGRSRKTLEQWFGDLELGLVAEHGAWLRSVGGRWRLSGPLASDWKRFIRPILDRYVHRTPGSMVEEKEFALVWHYRRVVPGLAEARAAELRASLIELVADLRLDVLEGSKVVEVRNAGIGKGYAAARWLTRRKRDFVLAVGDDTTDEDMFAAMPADAYTIKVGARQSRARYRLDSPRAVRKLLERMAK